MTISALPLREWFCCTLMDSNARGNNNNGSSINLTKNQSLVVIRPGPYNMVLYTIC